MLWLLTVGARPRLTVGTDSNPSLGWLLHLAKAHRIGAAQKGRVSFNHARGLDHIESSDILSQDFVNYLVRDLLAADTLEVLDSLVVLRVYAQVSTLLAGQAWLGRSVDVLELDELVGGELLVAHEAVINHMLLFSALAEQTDVVAVFASLEKLVFYLQKQTSVVSMQLL